MRDHIGGSSILGHVGSADEMVAGCVNGYVLYQGLVGFQQETLERYFAGVDYFIALQPTTATCIVYINWMPNRKSIPSVGLSLAHSETIAAMGDGARVRGCLVLNAAGLVELLDDAAMITDGTHPSQTLTNRVGEQLARLVWE